MFVNRREGLATTVTEVLETEQIKRSIIETKLHHEKPDYASSAKFIRKLKSILGSLNNAKNYASTIDKSLATSEGCLQNSKHLLPWTTVTV